MAGGKELTAHMRTQAERFGAAFAIAEVLDMELEQEIKRLHTTKGTMRRWALSLRRAQIRENSGFRARKEFQGRGVAYCATCDGEFLPEKMYLSSAAALRQWRRACFSPNMPER